MRFAMRARLCALTGWLGIASTAQLPAQAPEAPGRLVDVGGRRLHINCVGSASPTVVIENGSGAFSVDWALVQPAVAPFARVCTYDRAGHAWSDRGPIRDFPDMVVGDLHVLLREAHIAPPYILVGASMGGIFVRDYQRRFPEQVAGMVLVDPTHDEGLEYTIDGKAKTIVFVTAQEMRGFMNALLARKPSLPPEPTKLRAPFDRLPLDLQGARLWAEQRYVREIDMQDVPFLGEATRQEFIALRTLRLASERPLRSLPLVVLVNGRTSVAQKKSELAALSSSGEIVWVESSCHEIHLCSPQSVVQAVRDVVERVRRQGTR